MRLSWLGFLLLAVGCTGPNPAYLGAEAHRPVDGGTADGALDRSAAGADTAAPADAVIEAPDSEEPEAASSPPDVSPPDAIDQAPGQPVDAAQPPEVAVPADVGPELPTVPLDCAGGVANITGIAKADGVVVDADGTLYVLTQNGTHSHLGRVLPNGKPEPEWLEITYSPTPRGLALDSANQRLYALVIDGAGGLVMYENIKTTPIGSEPVKSVGRASDVTIGADRTVYYAQQSDRQVYRLSVTGGPPKLVTTAPLGDSILGQAPAGLAVAPNGNLLVGLERGGPIYELTLAGGLGFAR
jgi:hypothetical protein